jgi:three-Cys-motif partner protein
MTSYKTDGSVGSWAPEKLEILRKYLEAYTTVLKEQSSWCKGYYYIDALAGGGRAPLRSTQNSNISDENPQLEFLGYTASSQDEQQFIEGSPRVALDLSNPFTRYLFIDKQENRVQQLEELKRDYGDTKQISIRTGDANEILESSIVNNAKIDWKSSRAVVFLDPFGLQIPWRTLEGLASTKAIEVIVNFPVGMALQRLLQRDGKITPERQDLLDEYLGSPEWRSVVYEKQPTLFGMETHKAGDSGEKLALWYADRMKSLFGFGSSPRLIRNAHGGHLYYLIFAGPNKTGAKIAEDVLLGPIG